MPVASSSSFFPLRCTPGGSAWQALPDEVRNVWRLYEQVNESQWKSHAEIEQMQLHEVRNLLNHCIDQSPFYRARLQAAGIVPAQVQTLDDFRRLPTLSRGECQEHLADLRARAMPEGTVVRGRCYTSGSSGVPLEVLQTNIVQRWWWASTLRDLEWADLNPRGRIASIRPPVAPYPPDVLAEYQEGIMLPTWFPALQGLLDTGPSFGMDLQQEPRKQLAWLRRIEPNYLISLPSNLDVLASLILEDGVGLPSLRALQTLSETLTPEAQTRIEAALGVPIKVTYSCAEAGVVASPCPAGHGLHVHAENVLLEVVDDAGRPCAPGETGRVLLTSLHNYYQPFVRYEVQDHATVGHAACPCGRGLPSLARIEGKVRPFFQLADGRPKNSGALLFGLYELGGCRQWQVVQQSLDRVLIRVVPNRDWSVTHPEQIRRVVHWFFEGSMHVELELLEQIPRPANGKVRDLICELPPRSGAPVAGVKIGKDGPCGARPDA